MTSAHSSRRAFLASVLGGLGAAAARARTAAPLTAGDVLDRIKANVGIPWRAQTVDNLIAGTRDTPVRGIAVTMMATLEALQRATAAGKNMVITHEPTFFSHQDEVEPLGQNPAYRFKREFLASRGMVVFHFHDHWHGRRPDGIAVGMARELGWEKNVDPADPRLYTFPAVPLADFASRLAARLGARGMRVVGDRSLPVKRVLASWGFQSGAPAMSLLDRADVDVLIVGETREWELVEYAQDVIASGRKKALIVVGHVASEQAGMKYCAEWLRGFITEVPVEFLPLDEPYWVVKL